MVERDGAHQDRCEKCEKAYVSLEFWKASGESGCSYLVIDIFFVSQRLLLCSDPVLREKDSGAEKNFCHDEACCGLH